MKSLFRVLLWAVAAPSLAVLLLLGLSLQRAALVALAAPVNAADLARANAFLRSNDPRLPRPGTQRTFELTEPDLNLLLNQLAQRLPWPSSAQVNLGAGRARVRASMALPHSPIELWLNLDATLLETAGLPAVERLRIGDLPVPGWAARALRRSLMARVNASSQGRLAHDIIKSVAIAPARIELRYEWQLDTYQRLLGVLVPQAEQQQLKAYSDRLADLSRQIPTTGPQGQSVALAQLFPPLFELARQRTAAGFDAASENRAALLTLALHASGRGLGTLVPAAKAWRQPRFMPVTLYGREDFPQHLLISAVIAIEGGGPLADAIGVYKEVADAQGGSGFSFNDIAADRAGTRLGLLAKSAPEQLQARLAAGLQESQFMPDVSDLPEFLTEADFKKTYGGVDAPAYRQMLADIERRLDATALFAK